MATSKTYLTMRDPKRIDEILEVIRLVWTESPDLRLGQIIVGSVAPKQPCPEVFYIEDSELVIGLETLRQQITSCKLGA